MFMRYENNVDRVKTFFRHKFSRGLNFNRRRKRFRIQEFKTKAINVGIIALIVLIIVGYFIVSEIKGNDFKTENTTYIVRR